MDFPRIPPADPILREIPLIDKPLHKHLQVFATDAPGPGGANHEYAIFFETEKTRDFKTISFQKGGVNEVGLNGVSDEALLAILIDRAEHFSAGPFSSEHGNAALFNMREALECLRRRYEDRAARGVEGFSKA